MAFSREPNVKTAFCVPSTKLPVIGSTVLVVCTRPRRPLGFGTETQNHNKGRRVPLGDTASYTSCHQQSLSPQKLITKGPAPFTILTIPWSSPRS